jgi:uncharacterized protein YndB with AHSA1/START domain
MEKMKFAVKINASREKVWDVLWDDKGYREWTSVFHEGSYAETDWKEGSDVRFLTPEGSGMYSTIARKIPNEFMSFRHIGEVKGGVNQPLDDKTKQWSGATENYTLRDDEGGTELVAEMDMDDEFAGYFKETFPKALDKVKAIAERN